MKLPNNWTIAGYILCGAFALTSGIRYYVIWPDVDKAIAYVALGLVGCALAWLYDMHKSIGYDVDAQGEKIQDIMLTLKDNELIKDEIDVEAVPGIYMNSLLKEISKKISKKISNNDKIKIKAKAGGTKGVHKSRA